MKKCEALAEEINSWLENAVQNEEDPAGETGQELAAMHKEWLTLTWPLLKSTCRSCSNVWMMNDLLLL